MGHQRAPREARGRARRVSADEDLQAEVAGPLPGPSRGLGPDAALLQRTRRSARVAGGRGLRKAPPAVAVQRDEGAPHIV